MTKEILDLIDDLQKEEDKLIKDIKSIIKDNSKRDSYQLEVESILQNFSLDSYYIIRFIEQAYVGKNYEFLKIFLQKDDVLKKFIQYKGDYINEGYKVEVLFGIISHFRNDLQVVRSILEGLKNYSTAEAFFSIKSGSIGKFLDNENIIDLVFSYVTKDDAKIFHAMINSCPGSRMSEFLAEKLIDGICIDHAGDCQDLFGNYN